MGGAKKPTHPKYSAMVRAAIEVMRERWGSSRQAIQKYILTTYSVKDEKKTYTHIKIALRRGVDSGCLTQIRGSGASGSFKLADARKGSENERRALRTSEASRKTKSHAYVCKKTFVKVHIAENPAGGRQIGQRHLSKTEIEERSRRREFIAKESVTKANAKRSWTKVKADSKVIVKKSYIKANTANKISVKKSNQINVKRSNKIAVKKSLTKAADKIPVKKSVNKVPNEGKPNIQKFTLKKAAKFLGRETTKVIKKTAVIVRNKLNK
ncbi:histone H1-beta, late embryonic-like [Penaeus indicus]|uniref:histone H1-beta, late embryonic-like n=1 Tax=Penaeus indicus TaxID=29960 RepID=UPI00300CE5E1